MTSDDLLVLVEAGKLREFSTEGVELKRSWKQDAGKKISFLCNKVLTGSAWLIVGVEDSGLPSGFDETWAKNTEQEISQHLNQYLDPIQSICSLSCRCLSTKNWVVIIELANPGMVVRWNGKAYHGTGTTLEEMSPEQIMALTVSLPGLSDHSAQPSEGSYDDGLVSAFAKQVERIQGIELFTNLSSLPTTHILQRLRINSTNASRILFAMTPYRVVVFNNRNEPVSNQVRHSMFSLLSEQGLASTYEQISATASRKLKLPQRAIKEGLANAVAHAAYFDSNGEVLIEIHPSKIAISNLCLPESGYFANKWFSRSHKTVNNLLMETLVDARVLITLAAADRSAGMTDLSRTLF
jgi:predicted HTH transcriptional regulator